MTEPEPKQISDKPLVVATPPKRSNRLTFLVLVALIAGVTTATLYILDPLAPKDREHVTQWPRGFEQSPYEGNPGDYERATRKMQVIADALAAYREMTGGANNWPQNLDELQATYLLEPDFDMTGVLSNRPVVYNREIPMDADPGRWVLCHDIEHGWIKNDSSRMAVKGPRAAAVILADGTVKLLEANEMQSYGGLNTGVTQ